MASECFRLTIQGLAAGEQVQNVLHFLVDNNDDATALQLAQELVVKWDTSFETDWLEFQSEDYTLRWIQARRVIPSNGNSYWKEFPEGVADGLVTSDIGVLQLAPIMKLFTSLGNNLQGRVFLPPPPQTAVVSNVIQTFYKDDAVDCFANLLSFSGASHDWNLAVYSRKNATAAAVTTVTMSDILGSIGKRRKPM